MKSLDNIAEDLFNKIRGRFPSITIGNNEGKVTNDPLTARFFDFDYQEGEKNVGKVSISISEEKLSHEDVQRTAQITLPKMKALFSIFLENLLG